MEFFSLLVVATIVIIVLAIALFLKRRDAGLIAGLAVLYYWSLYGAWYIVIDKTGGFSGKNYHYLEQKLFPIALDSDYMTALALYAGFIILVEVTLLLALSRRKPRPVPRLLLRHEPILILGFIAGLASLLIIRDKLSAAWALNTSAYWYTRTETDEWFTVHQVLNRIALIPPAIGLATLLAGRRSRFFVSVTRRYTLPAYGALFAGMAAFTFVLGNKNEVFEALLCGLLAYLASVRRPKLWKAAAVAAAGMWFLYSIDFFRATPVSELSRVIEERLDEATEVGRFIASSNEAYGAHFSMYGVLATAAEPRFGYSLYALACSVVPRVLWPSRPRDIYLYYSESVGAIQNQGYSIHHATGWYLSFGHTGVAIGAVVMGLIWAYCLNAHQRIRPRSGLAFRLFAIVSPWLFVACLPPLVRAGPEGYKGWIIEGVLIPVGTLLFSCRPKKQRRAQPPCAWLPTPFYATAGLRHHPLP
jgi:hypothetical protein